ncbi:hypothetical protein NSK_007818 [Nannochloropsis salina CCMP1776]|uniref:Uncharacterized protein n=1 Tax=Nannochloropsis salina CCMP1776 TaxID=1027361 RepID=A0A4D9CTJ1_9STRA|nr:hypothetical protein NSK_007818 [Nannochloropsis salina CCMP1776]|eukprot:TFJ80863.1 hypothetical protein NSK_007818 [Nannochloropsis salina CCMP1776]
MTKFSTIVLVALLGFATILTTVTQECPRVFLKAKVRPNAKLGVLAGKGRAKITVMLKSKDPVESLDFQLTLPNGLSVERTAMRPSSKPYTPPQIVEDADGVTVISWQGLAFTKRKGGKRRFRVKVKADQCAPETLVVNALAYLMNATDTSCRTPLANPAIVKVRYLKRNKDATCTPTPAPTVNPTQPFVLLGEALRFSQGERLAPFEDRRLSLHTGINRHEGIIARYHPEDRQLQSINTPEACYEYCSLNGGEEVPFLFSWNTMTSQCFCCAGVCTPLIVDPDYNVYEAVLPRTLPPTSIPTATAPPTASPTPTPTASPTPGPTPTPTQAPSTTPTASPTLTPTASPTPGPTPTPTQAPSTTPTASPTLTPTASPTPGPTRTPTQAPSTTPTAAPTTDFSVDSLVLQQGENLLYTSVVSGDFAYFG